MVAKVIIGGSITALIGYNEQKVKRGVAECVLANGFLKDETALTRREKVARFMRLIERNQRTKTNALHVPISFSPEEKISREVLNSIAVCYMEKIGFGEQPYLVYLHLDTDIQHLHIVSTLIQEDGRRIPVHNIGRNESARARREIEQEFGLVKAETRGKLNRMLQEPRKKALKKMIDQAILSGGIATLDAFVATLKERNVDVRLHTNSEGRTFGITFYDAKSKTSFKGSELGKAYSVNAIGRRVEASRRGSIGTRVPHSSIGFGDGAAKYLDLPKDTSPSGKIVFDLIGEGHSGASPESTLRLSKRKKRRKKKRR
jgi:uncharacterized protein YbjQ (UPF0145 family)